MALLSLRRALAPLAASLALAFTGLTVAAAPAASAADAPAFDCTEPRFFAQDDEPLGTAQTVETCNDGTLSATPVEKATVESVSATAPLLVGSTVNSVRVVGSDDTDPDPATTADTEVLLVTEAEKPTSMTDATTTAIVSAPSHGTAALEGGVLTYTPIGGFSGDDSFVYSTPGGDVTVSIVVTPTAVDHTFAAPESDMLNTSVQVFIDAAAGTGLTLTGVDNASNGTVSLLNGNVRFTPTRGFIGTGSYEYTLTDALGRTVTATVTVTVLQHAGSTSRNTQMGVPLTVRWEDVGFTEFTAVEVVIGGGHVALVDGDAVYTPAVGFSGQASFSFIRNTPAGVPQMAYVIVWVMPNTADDSATTPAETSVLIDVLSNDGGDPEVVIDSVFSVTSGTAVIESGQIRYTPANGFSGTATFTYAAGKPRTMPQHAHVTVTVTPTAAAHAVVVPVGQSATILATDLVAASVGTRLTVTSVGNAVNGTVTVVDGNPTFVPATGFSGIGSFRYTVTDASAMTATATVTVAVTPAAQNDTATTTAGTRVSIAVLDNDLGTDLELTSNISATGGTAAISGDEITFTPTAGFSGPASVTYEARDAANQTSTATVAIAVTPVAVDDSASTPAGTAATIDVLGDDLGSGLTLTTVIVPVGVTAVIVDGDILYTPPAGFSGTVTFSYVTTDASAQTATADVTVTVLPTVAPVSTTTTVATAATVPTATFVAAGTGTDLALVGVSDAAHGTVASSGGNVTFTPEPGFSGNASFRFILRDGPGSEVQGTTTVKVQPAATSVAVTAAAGSPLTVDATAIEAAGTGTALKLVGVADAVSGTVALVDGDAVFTPADGFSGTASFSFTLEDSDGGAVTATATVTVLPVAAPSVSSGEVGEPITIDVAGRASGTGLVVTSVTPPRNGTAVINSDGTVTFTPRAGFSGIVELEYTVTDAQGQTAVGTVTITVMPAATVTVPVTPSLPFMGVNPGGFALLALALLGLGGLGLLARSRMSRPRAARP